jgi:hypothetical protein
MEDDMSTSMGRQRRRAGIPIFSYFKTELRLHMATSLRLKMSVTVKR